VAPTLNPDQAIARTPLKNLQAALAPLLYDASGQPMMAQGDPFGGRPLAPGPPLPPVLPPGTEPRQWFPWAGYNLSFTPRSESGDLTPFQVLRNLAAICDPVKNAMNDVKGEILGFGWDIKAKDEASQAQTAEIQAAKTFLKWPDRVHDFQQWLAMMMDENLTIDALSIYRRRTVTGDPYALMILDGSTVKPLVDVHGIPPPPPFPAYQQIGFGQVETEYTLPWHTPDGFQPDGEDKAELIYKPMWPRAWTPYGESPVERLIPTINLYARRHLHYLNFYTEGNLPEAFWKCPETWTPEQIGQAQDILDQLLVGNPKLRSRLRLMAGGEGTGLENPRGQDTWAREFDEALKRDIYAAFNTSPLPVVQMMNRATGEQADAAESDSGTKVRKAFIVGIINQEIEEFLGYSCIEFIWKDEKEADERLQMEKNVAYVGAGIYSIDEVRETEGKKPTGTPIFTETGAGLVKLGPELEVIGAKPGPAVPGDGAPPGAGSAGEVLAAAPKIPVLEKRLAAEPTLTRDALDDLKRWKKVALKTIATGRRRTFETTSIPAVLRTALAEWLEHAASSEDIRWGFAVLPRARRPLLTARARIRLERGLRAAVLEHFRARATELAATVSASYRGQERDEAVKEDLPGPTDAAIDGAMDWKVLVRKVEPGLEAAFSEGGDLAMRKVGEEAIAFGMLDQAAADYAEARAAEMVGMRRLEDGTLVENPNAEWSIRKTIRKQVHDLVARATKEGWTRQQLVDEIESATMWEARADAVARSEVAIAVNQGAAETYSAAGVQTIDILDGPGCLEDGHDDSVAGVNGETWTVEKFQTYPIGHPHCRRDGVPNVDSISGEETA